MNENNILLEIKLLDLNKKGDKIYIKNEKKIKWFIILI